MLAVRRRGTSDVRLMVRIAQLYYGMHLSQAEIGDRLGLSRFQVGRLLDRAVGGVHRPHRGRPPRRPPRGSRGRAWSRGSGSSAAVVADVPAATAGQEADDLARDAVAEVAVDLLGKLRPTGTIAVSWGRTMLEVARRLPMGWTDADGDRPAQRGGLPLHAAHPCQRDPRAVRGHLRGVVPRPGGTGDRGLQRPAGRADEGPGDPGDDRCRPVRPRRRVRPGDPGAGQPAPRVGLRGRGRAGAPPGEGCGGRRDRPLPGRQRRRRLAEARPADRGPAAPDLRAKPFRMGVAAGAGRGPIALAAIRAGVVNVLACDDTTAGWVLAHG